MNLSSKHFYLPERKNKEEIKFDPSGLMEERDGTDHDPHDERKGCGRDCGH